MPNPCAKCSRNVTRVFSPGLSCIGCSRYWHFQCADLTEGTFKSIVENKLSWTCKSCPRRSNIIPGALPVCSLSIPSASPRNSPSVTKSPAAASVTQASKAPKVGSKSSATSKKSAAQKPLTDSERISKLEEQFVAALNRIDFLEAQLSEKSSVISSLLNKAEEWDSSRPTSSCESQRSSDFLEIQGLPETALSNPAAAATAIGVQIGVREVQELLSCPPVRYNNRLRLSFASPDQRRNFLLEGKRFNREKKKFCWDQRKFQIHVNEELTLAQKALYRETKTFARVNGYKFVWVGVSGSIFLKKSEGFEPAIISSSLSLTKLTDAPLLSKCARPENEISSGSAASCSHHA
jgi:hypothetical protein